jgi:hypothetical protein
LTIPKNRKAYKQQKGFPREDMIDRTRMTKRSSFQKQEFRMSIRFNTFSGLLVAQMIFLIFFNFPTLTDTTKICSVASNLGGDVAQNVNAH